MKQRVAVKRLISLFLVMIFALSVPVMAQTANQEFVISEYGTSLVMDGRVILNRTPIAR